MENFETIIVIFNVLVFREFVECDTEISFRFVCLLGHCSGGMGEQSGGGMQ